MEKINRRTFNNKMVKGVSEAAIMSSIPLACGMGAIQPKEKMH